MRPGFPDLPLDRAGIGVRQESNKLLIVGAGIMVKGRIDNCQRLIVEGDVQATLQAEELQVNGEGVFRGKIEVDEAVIAGVLDGTVVVRGRLEVTETGRVSGRVRYAKLVVRDGGRLSGDVQYQSAGEPEVDTAERFRA